MTKVEDLKESIDKLVTKIDTQNDLIDGLPVVTFRVSILWKVFVTVCTFIGLGVLGLIAKAMFGGG